MATDPLRAMDLKLLKIFDAIMAERSVTRAALALHMTQPAVSNALNRLRELLGDPLLLKTRAGMAPTARAQLIWPVIRDALSRIHEVLKADAFDPARDEAEFRFAMSDYVATQAMQPFFIAQQAVAPRLRLHLRPFTVETVASQLERGELDMAAGVFTPNTLELRTLPLQTLDYTCAMRKGHPLLTRELPLDDFLEARHLVVSLHGKPSVLDRELAAVGLRRNAFLTVNQFAMVPELLARTDLICVVPQPTIDHSPYAGVLACRPPPFSFQPRVVNLVWHERTDRLPAHRWLREKITGTGPAA